MTAIGELLAETIKNKASVHTLVCSVREEFVSKSLGSSGQALALRQRSPWGQAAAQVSESWCG